MLNLKDFVLMRVGELASKRSAGASTEVDVEIQVPLALASTFTAWLPNDRQLRVQ